MSSKHSRPLIIAHRGASSVAPENTIAAFTRAIEDGANGIELDVQLTRDGVAIVIHDYDLRRTTGRPGVVTRMAAAELAQLDAGAWFNRKYPRLSCDDYVNLPVPTLDDVFSLVSETAARDFICYVELKVSRTSRQYQVLVETVAHSIRKWRLHPNVVVVSFNLSALSHTSAIDATIRTGALFEPRASTLNTFRSHQVIEKAMDSGAKEILLHRLMAGERLVDLARKRGLLPVVWTVDDVRWIGRARRWGIHAVITNNPGKMISAANVSGS